MRNEDHIFDNARGGTEKLDRYDMRGTSNQSHYLTSNKKQLSEPYALE